MTMASKRQIFRRVFRFFVQVSSIILFFYLLKKTTFPVSGQFPLNAYFRVDSFLGIALFFSNFYLPWAMMPGIGLAFLVAMFGNFFCWWFCPLGGTTDVMNLILLRRKWKLHFRLPFWVPRVRVFLLAVLFFLCLVSLVIKHFPFFVWVADPFVILTRAIVLKGIWLVVLCAILVTGILVPRFWCNYLCPVGTVFFLLGTKLRGRIRMILLKYFYETNK